MKILVVERKDSDLSLVCKQKLHFGGAHCYSSHLETVNLYTRYTFISLDILNISYKPASILPVRTGSCVVDKMLHYQSVDGMVYPQLLQPFEPDFKPRSRLRMTYMLEGL